jgi:hypothetical protein
MSDDSRYTDPELRERLKKEITDGDRGGRPGQWSARKAQLLASEYKKAGGGYTTDKEHESEGAQHLDQWTAEDWQTKDGDTRARSKGETKRYLPKEAWDKLSPEEREATDRKKREGSRKGDQFVGNTDEARQAGAEARHDNDKSDGQKSDCQKTGGDEPFPGYDDANAKDIVRKLGDLDDATLRAVERYEKKHSERKTVLEKVAKARGH